MEGRGLGLGRSRLWRARLGTDLILGNLANEMSESLVRRIRGGGYVNQFIIIISCFLSQPPGLFLVLLTAIRIILTTLREAEGVFS